MIPDIVADVSRDLAPLLAKHQNIIIASDLEDSQRATKRPWQLEGTISIEAGTHAPLLPGRAGNGFSVKECIKSGSAPARLKRLADVDGFQVLLASVRSRRDPDHEHMLSWGGYRCDPCLSNVSVANERLARLWRERASVAALEGAS